MRALTKSRYLAGLQCTRRLWQQLRAPERAEPPDAEAGSRMALGQEIGRRAWALCPDGVLVEERDFDAAVRRTAELIGEGGPPALFEAAFEHEGVRVRVDLLERLEGGRFGLREVKSGTQLRDEHLDDVVVQLFVLRGAGLEIASVELILLDPDFALGSDGVGAEVFARHDVTDDALFLLTDVGGEIAGLRGVAAGDEPLRPPGPHCRRPVTCEFLAWCRRGLPEDRLERLPRLRTPVFEALLEQGVQRIGEIPEDFPLDPPQQRARRAWQTGGEVVDPSLAERLEGTGPPAAYLDFETLAPALPIFAGMSPYQVIAYQWSLHRDDGSGQLTHDEFLPEGPADPRRAFAESLLGALLEQDDPIHVYSGHEERVLRGLSETFPDLAEALGELIGRLVDLLPLVRATIYMTGFAGSFSIKSVAPALVPGFGYGELDGIQDGGAAARAIAELLTGTPDAAWITRTRESLFAYCKRDTLALVELHRALRARSTLAG